MLDVMDPRVGGVVVLVDPVEPGVQVPQAGGVIDRAADLLLPPIERPIFGRPVGKRLRRPLGERRGSEVEGGLGEAELGLRVVVWVSSHRSPRSRRRMSVMRCMNFSLALSEVQHCTW